MVTVLNPREIALLHELELCRTRGDRPTPFFLASVLEMGVEELEALVERLFGLGLVEWEVVVAGGVGVARHLGAFGNRHRWCPRITRRGLDCLRGGRLRTREERGLS
ncbi:MAG: hypothetical protein RDU89_04995 [bacterium]|nr:hypothetical protein [bacterium]